LQETQRFIEYDRHGDVAQIFADAGFQYRPNAEVITIEHWKREFLSETPRKATLRPAIHYQVDLTGRLRDLLLLLFTLLFTIRKT
jgi:hypothetical protein